ncbi:MAG: hydrophobic/amphiphilic exporter (mainly bacteria), family [Candidatus Sumerlaeota bacterium]|nr:hydrophobic/amphiphilic exporter (mainly bacteria), family [Candidatus Sumerlaeota bacterium]
MSLSRFAVNAPVKVTMIFVAVLVLGFISLRRLPTNLFPDIRAPKVTTTIRTVGLSPLEVERRICQPLERQLYTLRGVSDVTTIARADSAVIVTEFTWDTPLDFAFLDVKKAVSDIQRQRSTEIESASVLRYDPNAAPVMIVGLTGGPDTDLEDLRRLAEQTLRPRFERLEGVANVVVSGGVEREARIALDEALLVTYGIDVQTVVSALQQENVNATGGYITEGTQRYLLKAVGEFEELTDVRAVVVTRKDNNPILLGDIAEVTFVPREPKDMVLVDGREAVGLSFYREAEGNTVAVSRVIREEIEAIEGGEAKPRRGPPQNGPGAARAMILPPGASIVVANDQAEFIRDAIREVRNNALFGGLLAVGVLLLFLRDLRTTLIVAIAIPVSIVATFNLMYFQGLTLNLMTLGGLALGCGMLVDNAIVVLENIFRLRQRGVDRREAARLGVSQVAAALFASTLTTVVVFLPIVYVKGVAGLLFKEQALTVAYSLAASLVVALLLIPMLASHFLGDVPASVMKLGTEEQPEAPRTFYARVLGWTLRGRLLVLIAAGATVFLGWELLKTIPQEFLPRTEQRQVEIRLVLPNGTPIEGTRRVVDTVVGDALRFDAAIDVTYARIGESEGEVNANTEDPDGPNTADVYVRLHNWDNPTSETIAAGMSSFRSSDFVEAIKPRLDTLPDVKADIRLQQGSILELLGSGQAPLLYEIRGEELVVLQRLAEEARRRFEATPGLLNVRTNILEGAPEVMLTLDKAQLSRLGLDVQSVATTIRNRLEGAVAGQIKRDSGDIDLRVDVDYGEETLETLRDIVLTTPSGAIIPLGNIADMKVERGPREIVRRRQMRVARVMADLEPGVKLSQAIAQAEASLAGMRQPTGYVTSFTGEEAQRKEAFDRLGFALALSILLVYMVMASVFESFLQPFIIMLTIPLAGVGVVLGFLLTGQTLNIMGLIGVVMLGGIVVNNAIVLLDCVNQVRGDHPGLCERDSLVLGCQRRLRPVLMTTLTTLLGLLPLALGLGQGAELRQAMAIAVLGGLLSSTVLTLFVVPVCQSYLDSARALARRWRRRKSKDAAAEDATPAG